MLSLLDDIYGVLFLPQQTLTALRDRSVVWSGAGVVVGVNVIEGLRKGMDSLFLQVVIGLLVWVGAAVLLTRLSQVFNRSVSLDRVLGLTGFATLPWMFFSPALNLGGSVGALGAVAVVGWFLVYQGWSIAIALEVEVGRIVTLIPLAAAGGIVTVFLLLNGFSILGDIINLFHLS